MNCVWDCKSADLVLDDLLQLLLQLWCGLGALGQHHIRVNALALDVVIHPAQQTTNSEPPPQTGMGLAKTILIFSAEEFGSLDHHIVK